jgi:hypothetical protein
MDFHETWNERHATGGHITFISLFSSHASPGGTGGRGMKLTMRLHLCCA